MDQPFTLRSESDQHIVDIATEPAIETNVYLRDFSDEVMPCEPTLEGWATWLQNGDRDQPGPHAAHGDELLGFTVDVLADVVATPANGQWTYSWRPKTATQFAARWNPGLGWDAETISNSLESLIALNEPCDGEIHVACLRDRTTRRYRFTLDDGQPLLTDLGPVQ